MTREDLIQVFSELGRRLDGFGAEDDSRIAITRAMEDNIWFTFTDIECSVGAICSQMLQTCKLREWLDSYDLDYSCPLDIAVVCAGNIPLVGFSDLLCVAISGCNCYVKSSSKDNALMEYVINMLKDIEPSLPIYDYIDAVVPSAVIATGSDNTNRYFRSAFKGIPSILRSGRGSVAVLDGCESDDILCGLADDIFSYSGLGCRNVSMVFVPVDYDAASLCAILMRYSGVNPHYSSNYLQRKALLTMEGSIFFDGGFFVMTEGYSLPAAISEVVICRYGRIEEVETWITANDALIQCVVSGFYMHPRGAKIGAAQVPTLYDYPDGKDVMAFIAGLQGKMTT